MPQEVNGALTASAVEFSPSFSVFHGCELVISLVIIVVGGLATVEYAGST